MSLSDTTPEIYAAFQEYRAKNPVLFPTDQPEEKQFEFYQSITHQENVDHSAPQPTDQIGDLGGFAVNLTACETAEQKAAQLEHVAGQILEHNHAGGIPVTPFEFFIQTFQLEHHGDLTAARAIALTFASSSVANGDGLHTFLSGTSGRGKSHSAQTMFKQLPKKYAINRSFSDRYLLYAATNPMSCICPGSVILIDDQTMTPTIQELFKVAVSNFREGVEYGTVQKQTAVELKMPPKISWVLLKVDDPGDDQVMNRLIQARVIDDDQKVKAAADMIQSKYHNLSEKNVRVDRDEIIICRHMWNWIKEHPVAVECPCAGHVRFADYHNLRTHEIFFNLMMAHAVIFQRQRIEIGNTVDGTKIIRATKEDYIQAKNIFEALHCFGGQKHNTVQNEDVIIEAVLSLGKNMVTIKEIAKVGGMSYNNAYRALNGRRGKDGNLLGGLLEKCPCIQKADKRGRQEIEYEHNYQQGARGQTTELIRKESFSEDVYSVDLEGLKLWREGKGELVSLPHTFNWGV